MVPIVSADIATDAVTTTEILDETIIAGDIATGGVATIDPIQPKK